MLLLLVFLYFAALFVRKYQVNKELMSQQIFIYSPHLFPTLKYLFADNRMAQSNTETIYFCLACLTFLIWSFLAGLLVKLEDRYIGISFTAATLALIYIYVITRLKKALFLTVENFKYANFKFYEDAFAHALEVKRRWRYTENGEKKLMVAGGSKCEADKHEVSHDEILKELSYSSKWQ